MPILYECVPKSRQADSLLSYLYMFEKLLHGLQIFFEEPSKNTEITKRN